MRTKVSRQFFAVLACALFLHGIAFARGGRPGEVRASELPPQASQLLELIARGGPFAFDRDGVVFGNRERALPDRPRGYYHEYTVKTPGVRSRGARRIVCGGDPRSTRDCYYSDDHYQTFRLIR
ncbi:MAG: ribonuclease [Casimicrobiaceae bacterium]